MKMSEVIARLVTRVPNSETWSRGEKYGPYNIVNDEAEVTKVLYCVTPTHDVVNEFRTKGYDLLVSHHPYVVGVPQVVLHTALDCCLGGMNDQWRDAFDLVDAKHFDRNLGWYGKLQEPLTLSELIDTCEQFSMFSVQGTVYSRRQFIESVCVCSGLGGLVLREAEKTGADCYITGQMTSDPLRSRFPAIIEVGHTASEYVPGFNVVANTLPGVNVRGASQPGDHYGDEVYKEPLWHSIERNLDGYVRPRYPSEEKSYWDDFEFEDEDGDVIKAPKAD